MSVAALVLAAGRGKRLAAAVPKAFVPLADRPLLAHALEMLAAAASLDRLVPVIAGSDRVRMDALVARLQSIDRVSPWVAGGAERQDSVRLGLASLPEDVEWVAVHDAARPLVNPRDVDRVVGAAREHGAAILAVPMRDTVKRVRNGQVVETPPRSECWSAQTPQVFRIELLREAIEKALAEQFRGTDDAQLVERLGVRVAIVEGDPSNLKVTDAADLKRAEQILRDRAAARSAERGESDANR